MRETAGCAPCDSSGVSEVSDNRDAGEPVPPPHIDVVDQSWIGAPAAVVAPYLRDRRNWARWWPELELDLDEDRGDKGLRWRARARTATGRMEVWLQPDQDGTVAHYFLALTARDPSAPGRQTPDPGAAGSLDAGEAEALARHFRARAKSVFWALGDRLEPARLDRLVAPRGLQHKPFVL